MPRAETSPTVSIADWMDAWSARRPASGPAMPKARKANIELIDNTVERFWAEARARRGLRALPPRAWGGTLDA